MRKNLAACGNSLALIIDKPIRRLLGLGRNTQVEMWTDGRRIIIEPLPPEHPTYGSAPETEPRVDERRLKLDAFGVIMQLTRRFAMKPEQFDQLHHEGRGMRGMLVYTTQVELGMTEATADELATLRRFEECLALLQAGTSWEDAIASARQRVPVTRRESPNSSLSSHAS
jgi:bifunctional DNA-binding transcriptional regulator/antitoxin component of YhaV-PrlF toxin-antitoxin module